MRGDIPEVRQRDVDLESRIQNPEGVVVPIHLTSRSGIFLPAPIRTSTAQLQYFRTPQTLPFHSGLKTASTTKISTTRFLLIRCGNRVGQVQKR
jgi:hypothetical protein